MARKANIGRLGLELLGIQGKRGGSVGRSGAPSSTGRSGEGEGLLVNKDLSRQATEGALGDLRLSHRLYMAGAAEALLQGGGGKEEEEEEGHHKRGVRESDKIILKSRDGSQT